MTTPTNLTRARIEAIRDGSNYTLGEHRTLCEMAMRAAAEPEAPTVSETHASECYHIQLVHRGVRLVCVNCGALR